MHEENSQIFTEKKLEHDRQYSTVRHSGISAVKEKHSPYVRIRATVSKNINSFQELTLMHSFTS